VSGALYTHTLLLLFVAGHECKFAAPFKNGVVQYIATKGNTEDFENPHIKGKVVAAMSSMWGDGNLSHGTKIGGPSHLVEHPHDGSTRNFTKNEANSSVFIDLGKGRSLVACGYCLRHGRDSGDYRLQSWDFEGSNDGSSYTVLRAHRNDNSLPEQAFSVASWKVEGVKQAYRYFRIRMTGQNSGYGNGRFCNDTHCLMCAGIELYGMLLSR
jgi:hypothetical protein